MANPQSTKTTATAARPTPPEVQTHQVKNDDTLESIAKQYDVDVADLQRWNAIKRPEHVWPGMTIRVTRGA